jgi:two-component system cell cycle response regulator
VDLDHFKRVNDTYGHLAGDEVLKEVAARLTASVRPGDLVGRFGGEEFTVFLPGAGREAALAVARRCHEAIRARPVSSGGAELAVTASVGAASAGAALQVLAAVMEAADGALYEAKESGRDRVVQAAA